MKKNKLPNIISILVLTLVTVLMWVGFSIYRAFTLKPASVVQNNILASLSPSLDANTINKVESSLYFTGSQIPEVGSQVSPSPTPLTTISTPLPATVSATPIATISATPVITPSPTP